ncbi:hypothetical protein ASPBRDRAFT_352813 [Aspergillus brasiliensis CBS 101740]|uniref:Uncharacterized protein n=1 Tax=Aspergillus brasiliensis (strain CBS 101740 / IMI 381727 / IBT 21946) TaxID=767769 RepID=A0A1L9U6E3_ASPBC|nr:hypothetical protein ASPBRDRAFT_352813 [Aspergillus brasiliensis CBS 101740]
MNIPCFGGCKGIEITNPTLCEEHPRMILAAMSMTTSNADEVLLDRLHIAIAYRRDHTQGGLRHLVLVPGPRSPSRSRKRFCPRKHSFISIYRMWTGMEALNLLTSTRDSNAYQTASPKIQVFLIAETTKLYVRLTRENLDESQTSKALNKRR